MTKRNTRDIHHPHRLRELHRASKYPPLNPSSPALNPSLTLPPSQKVNVTRPGPTYLLGQTSHPTSQSLNTVRIIWRARAVTGLDNAFTSTLTIAPNLNASLTGSGPTGFAVPDDTPFGCTDFRTYNLDFINDFAPYCELLLLILLLNLGK